MHVLSYAVTYFLSFKSFVVLPVIIFILAIVFRIKFTTAVKSSLLIGIGFIGIFIVFDYFVGILDPVIRALSERHGLDFEVLDVGWPPLAAITWSFDLAPVLLIIFLAVNIFMLIFKLTKTVDIDIWNYWHVILVASMVYSASGNVYMSVAFSVLAFIIVLKLSDWSAPLVYKLSGIEGVCIPHLSGIAYFPFALIGDKLINKVPGLNRINLNPENIQKKLGLFGEPITLGLLIGIGLGIGGGYDIKQISELAVGFAAVIYILPIMAGILGSSLIPISEGMKAFISRRFPNMGQTFIGLDVAVLFSVPSVVVTSLLLIPVALVLALILPGINFIPMGELTNLLVPAAFICAATRGNIIRSFIIGIPVVIANLYIASNMASFFTKMAASDNYEITGYKGTFTSFLDGGSFFRAWMVKVASGDLIGLLLIPVALVLLYFTWKIAKKEVGKG